MDIQTQSIIDRLSGAPLPRHIAIIMDGNGRWAKQRSLPRSAGHYEGVTSVRRATELCSDTGVGFLTLYAFSTENWNRPQEEVDTLMTLIGMAIERDTPRPGQEQRASASDRRHRAYARRRARPSGALPPGHVALFRTDAFAVSELFFEVGDCRGARRLARLAADGSISADEIGEEAVEAWLATSGMPAPDLLIRTGGEKRLSNFLLWQAAYAELYFTDTLWPDFGKEALADAMADFQCRERRFGRTSEQVEADTAFQADS